MYAIYHYPTLETSEIVEIHNPNNEELFITPFMIDFWETEPFKQ